jgi:hypothetical protein
MPVPRSVLALCLCSLGPFAHETGRKKPLPGDDLDRPRLALPLESPLGHAGVASFGNGDSALTLAASSADSQNAHRRVTTDYRGLFRDIFRLRFRFRNQGLLTPYANIFFRGTHGGDGVAVSSIAAATDRLR